MQSVEVVLSFFVDNLSTMRCAEDGCTIHRRTTHPRHNLIEIEKESCLDRSRATTKDTKLRDTQRSTVVIYKCDFCFMFSENDSRNLNRSSADDVL